MEINYIILAHNHPFQLARLVQRLLANEVRFYIHIDMKSDLDSFFSILPTTKQIVYIENRENCIWGDSSIVSATLNCMKQIVCDGRTGYTVLLSGQDYPLKTNDYIHDFLAQNYGVNFINLFLLPTKNWADERDGMNRVEYYKLNISDCRADILIIPPLTDSRAFKHYTVSQPERVLKVLNEKLELLMHPRPSLSYINRFYGGSQWWAFPIETINYIMDFIGTYPDYRDFFKYSFVPDELFFHTIVGNTPDLFEKTQESLTYVYWVNNGYIRPAIFDISYYDKLIIRDELFARKFDSNLDSEILDWIDETRKPENQLKYEE